MQRFEYARAEEKTNVAERIKEMLQTGTLLLQIPDPNRLLGIPLPGSRPLACFHRSAVP
jgi:hypothetical protein